MKFKFDAHLDFQDDAINSVVDLFKGQNVAKSLFTVSAGAYVPRLDQLKTSGTGIGNRLDITEEEILENLQKVQLKNGLPQTKDLHGMYDFDIEMETGTGKTYVYSKSMLELNQRYGFTKFIIIVPSVAIREGVYKSFQITEEHFRDTFNGLPYQFFIYNSDKLEQVRDFAVNDCVSIMIINIDAFRRSFDDPYDDTKKANIIHRPNDRLNGMKPIDLIKETNPIVVIDEPQSVDTTEKASDAIASLNPLCIFRYSATHVKKHNLIYRLDAIDAYEKKLVKGIDVAGFSSVDQHNDAYIKLISVDNKNTPITARIEVDAASKNGLGIERKTIKVKKNDDLSEKTRRDIYNDYFVNEIYCEKGNEFISFTPKDVYVELGKSVGDVDDSIIKRKMIAKTIQEHLDKEVEYNKDGIKVLSLFFIDRVANYRDDGPYSKMFEEEYVRLIKSPKYRSILKDENPIAQAQSAHGGYFSGDSTSAGSKSGKWKDSSGKSAADDSLYNIIMKDKEKLLSMNERLRFIFSHSALREGWDNPNVFQICTLNETKSDVKKRQEIGRGLRLCVDQTGARVHDPYKNQLTVMANESYEEFAAKLQNEYEEDSGIRFGVIEKHTFSNIVVRDDKGEAEYLGQEKSETIYDHFVKAGYIDLRGKVQDRLKRDIAEKKLDLPEEVKASSDAIVSVCMKVSGRLNIKNNDDKRKISLNKEVCPEDFQALWDKIKYRTKYNLHFDSGKLIRDCIADMERGLNIKPPKLVYSKAKINIDAGGVTAKSQLPEVVQSIDIANEDLPDIITYLQNRTDLTRKTIVSILVGYDRIEEFKKNPQMFMEQTAKIIITNVRRMAMEGISYIKLGDTECYAQELFSDEELFGYLDKNMVKTNRSLYDYTVYDSEVEKNFALELEEDNHVRLFFKLPDWFKISTPIGNYNPDWAVLMNFNGDERLYFVFETKGNIGNNRFSEEFKIRCGEMHFKALNNGVNYQVRTSLKDLVLEGEQYFEMMDNEGD